VLLSFFYTSRKQAITKPLASVEDGNKVAGRRMAGGQRGRGAEGQRGRCFSME